MYGHHKIQFNSFIGNSEVRRSVLGHSVQPLDKEKHMNRPRQLEHVAGMPTDHRLWYKLQFETGSGPR